MSHPESFWSNLIKKGPRKTVLLRESLTYLKSHLTKIYCIGFQYILDNSNDYDDLLSYVFFFFFFFYTVLVLEGRGLTYVSIYWSINYKWKVMLMYTVLFVWWERNVVLWYKLRYVSFILIILSVLIFKKIQHSLRY